MTKNAEGVLLKKSKLTTNGKPNLPAPSKLVEGELAINYAEGVETISTKNESGTVVTFSSDDYYTTKKLGDYFTGENSAKTVTEVMIEKERVTAEALIDLDSRKVDFDDIPELWHEGFEDSDNGAVKLSLNSTSTGIYSVAEGNVTTASGDYSHAEGYGTTASGSYTHTEGCNTTASTSSSHAEGYNTQASGSSSHAEGYYTKATGDYSHSEGYFTTASTSCAHAEGYQTNASNSNAHAEGAYTKASGSYSHAEGYQTSALTQSSHAEGSGTTASGKSAHAEGYQTKANGSYSHAEGNSTSATNESTHAEGYQTKASGYYSHSEGYNTVASNTSSHAEGYNTNATGDYAHSEGNATQATAQAAHAEGMSTKATGYESHAEGFMTSATTYFAHAEGNRTIAKNSAEHASGQYNVSSSASTTFGDSGNTLFSVGNGTAEAARHNAFEIRQNGDIYIVNKDGNDVKLQDEIGNIDVDQVLDETTSASTNPVATKAVYDVFHEFETVVSAAINDLETKKLEESDVDQVIDSTTSADTNPVSTSAVYGFVTSYTPSITVDQVLDNTTSASTNPVSSKAVYDAVTDNEMVWANAFAVLSGVVSSHTEDTNIHLTSSEKEGLTEASTITSMAGYDLSQATAAAIDPLVDTLLTAIAKLEKRIALLEAQNNS